MNSEATQTRVGLLGDLAERRRVYHGITIREACEQYALGYFARVLKDDQVYLVAQRPERCWTVTVRRGDPSVVVEGLR